MSATGDGLSAWLTARGELETAIASVRGEVVEALVTRLRPGSGRVFFSGQGRSGLLADMVAMRFMQLGAQAHAVGEVTSPSLRAGDSLVVVSGSGSTPASVEIARVARRQGGTVILLTQEAAGPIQELADETVVITVSGTLQFGNTLFEHVALLMLDSVALALMNELDDPFTTMKHNHANLQ